MTYIFLLSGGLNELSFTATTGKVGSSAMPANELSLVYEQA